MTLQRCSGGNHIGRAEDGNEAGGMIDRGERDCNTLSSGAAARPGFGNLHAP